MTVSIQANPTTFNWEQWLKLPRVEREAELKEALKQHYPEDLRQHILNRGGDPDGPNLHPGSRKILSGASNKGEFDVITREAITADAVGNSDVTPIGRFPFWDIAETDGEVNSSDMSDQQGPKGPIKCGEERDYPLNGMPYQYFNGVFHWIDSAAIDPLTGSKISTTAAINHNAMDAGHVAGDLGTTIGMEPPVIDKMGQSLGLWDVASSDMETLEGNQVDDTFMSLSASDLPSDQEPNAMADLLPVAADPLA